MELLINVTSSRFDQIYGCGCLYVDKTSFIKEWWNNKSTVTLITRPRRFGKSLLLSTVERFFEPAFRDMIREVDGTPLFEGLDIWTDERMRRLHGQVPVISMTLSGTKRGTPGELLDVLADQVSTQYSVHKYILNSENLIDAEKDKFLKFLDTGGGDHPEFALKTLCQYLSCVYETQPVLLLDEYDTPLTEAFVKGTVDLVVDVLRTFFVTAYKDNPFFSKCLITGITRTAQQSLFSDFNNPRIDTLQESIYPAALGYTEDEVKDLLEQAGFADRYDQVKSMYDGYMIGTQKDIYNPYSVNYFLDSGKIRSYWVNSSENALAREVIRNGVSDIQEKVKDLLDGKTIVTELPTDLIYQELYNDSNAAFSLLFAAGFLKPVAMVQAPVSSDLELIEVAIPNGEVRKFYKDICVKWFGDSLTNINSPVRRFHRALLAADKDGMTEALSELAVSSIGEQDTADNPRHPPENFYHGLVLGLTVWLEDQYSVKSNREGGTGRYDISMIPRMDNPRCRIDELFAFCIEFKVREKEEATLVHTVHRAVQQIQERKYTQPLLDLGIPMERIRCFGIAFDGKKVLVGDGTEPLPDRKHRTIGRKNAVKR